MTNLLSLCLHRESLTCLCLSTKLENVTCSCQDTKIWLFVMSYPHLQVNMFQRLKVIFKAAAFLLGQTALIWSACVEVQSSQVLFTNVPKQEMMHWCFRANHPGTFLVSSVVLFLSSFSSFFVFSGATSAPCLIFIFPAIFYIRIVPKDREPLSSTPKILVRPSHYLPPFMCWLGCCCQTLSTPVAAPTPRLPALLRWAYPSWWWVWVSSSSTGRRETVSPPKATRWCCFQERVLQKKRIV